MQLAAEELHILLQAEKLDRGAISEQLMRFLAGAIWVVGGIFSALILSVKSLARHIPILGVIAATLSLLADTQKLIDLLLQEQIDRVEVEKALLSIAANLCMLAAAIIILAAVANPYSAPAIIALALIATAVPLTIAIIDCYEYEQFQPS